MLTINGLQLTWKFEEDSEYHRNDELTVEMTVLGDDSLEIPFAEMYEAPAIQMQFLSALATHYGTTNVNVGSRIDDEGCPTCDYGSLYGNEIVVKNITKNFPRLAHIEKSLSNARDELKHKQQALRSLPYEEGRIKAGIESIMATIVELEETLRRERQ